MHPRTRCLPDRQVLAEHSKACHLSQFSIRKRRKIEAGCNFGEDLDFVELVPVFHRQATMREDRLTARFNPFTYILVEEYHLRFWVVANHPIVGR